MKGSDKIEMTINIGGELIKLNVKFDDQNSVRDAEREVKLFLEKMKKAWPQNSDRNLLAMAAYQFALWCQNLRDIQEDALEIANHKINQINQVLNNNNIQADFIG